MATPASENDGEGTRSDPDGPSAGMDVDTAIATGNVSQGGISTPEENKLSSDTDIGQEAGQLEADAEVEPGMIDGETDAEVDLDTAGWFVQKPFDNIMPGSSLAAQNWKLQVEI